MAGDYFASPKARLGGAHDPLLGMLVANRYDVYRKLGEGSVGQVYACFDTVLCQRTVALKTFSPGLLHSRESLRRYEREVSVLQFLHHPNVARFYDVVCDERVAGFTMELLQGGSLRSVLDDQKVFSPRGALRLLTQVCSGLTAIHKRGFVHRDLTPSNLMFSGDGLVKIVDFGITIPSPEACCPSDTGTFRICKFRDYVGAMVNEGERESLAGTVDYMSPEQLDAKWVDQRSDIYALGTVAYEILTGRHPYADYEGVRKVWAKVFVDPPPITSTRPDCPKALDLIVRTAMQRDPSDRFATSADMLKQLWRLDSLLEFSRGNLARRRRRRWPRLRALWGQTDSCDRPFHW